MADTQHNLRIKATLDASQLQQELDRLNQTAGQKSVGTSSTQSTTRILNKLDSTLNKLNATVTRLADIVRRPLPSGMSQRIPDSSGYFMAKAFDQMSNKEFADAVRQIDKHQPNLLAKAASDAGLTAQELQVLRMRGIISDSTAANIGAVKKARPLNPPIVSENVMHVFPDGSFQLAPRDAPFPSTQQPSTPAANGDFKKQLRAFGIGTATSFAAGQLSQWGAATDNAGMSLAGSVLGGAGAGAMTGAIFGPWGAALGAAFGALSQGALELVKSFKQLDEAARSRVLLSERAAASAAGGLENIRAQRVVLGPDADRMLEVSQLELSTLEKSREHLLLRQQKLASADITDKTAEQIKQTAEDLSTTEAEISAKKRVIETLKSRKEALDEEVLAGQRLAQAERDFADAIRRNEERIVEQWHSDSQSNIRSYREAQKQYMETMLRGREITQDRMQRMGFERDVQMVRLGMWRGANAEDQFKNARRLRTQIMDLNAEALSTDSPKRLEEIQKLITGMQGEFQHAMMMGQLLKDLGSPLQKLQLGSLTSLANRGVNMGERTEMQRPYDKKMDEMVDLLQNIEENTRAAEKAIWE